MPLERITFLVKKKLDGTATDEENAELAELFLQADETEINASLKPLWDEYKTTVSMPAEQSDEILAKILNSQTRIHSLPQRTSSPLKWLRYAAAAVFLFAIAGASYLLFFNGEKVQPKTISYKGDVAPGRDGARLTLSDGRIILIDSIKDGLIAVDRKIKIYKKDGKLHYNGITDETFYNVITTDRGRQWSAILPDGTEAWLNASSTLRYPVKFASNERLVIMTGEAAFKVVHNAAQPFRVKVGKQVIEDVGTEFNVKAYDDEAEIKTTLIEGSANITTAGQQQLLKAGQLSTVNNATQQNIISKGDIDEATAWRKGLFSFKDADIQTVMKDISRWYNVEVKYEGLIPEIKDFSGKMGRSLTLMQTLKALSTLRVHFRIEEDKRIVIMP